MAFLMEPDQTAIRSGRDRSVQSFARPAGWAIVWPMSDTTPSPRPASTADAAGPDTAERFSTSFGFRPVDPAEKGGLVRAVFDSVAPRYDLMNDLMSFGVHRLWKDALVDWLAPRAGMTLIDVAGGTGDIARRVLARIGNGKAAKGRSESRAVICDINAAMLTAGRQRSDSWPERARISWVAGDAESLPFADRAADAYTIAFGIRNVTRLDGALAEARRVLKPGGRFLCLEFGPVVVPGLDAIYETYSFRVLPWLGRQVADDEEAYRYLAESIRKFPAPDRFAALMTGAGLERVRIRRLSGGIATLYSAWRL